VLAGILKALCRPATTDRDRSGHEEAGAIIQVLRRQCPIMVETGAAVLKLSPPSSLKPTYYTTNARPSMLEIGTTTETNPDSHAAFPS
jgi:hypothetical protein